MSPDSIEIMGPDYRPEPATIADIVNDLTREERSQIAGGGYNLAALLSLSIRAIQRLSSDIEDALGLLHGAARRKDEAVREMSVEIASLRRENGRLEECYDALSEAWQKLQPRLGELEAKAREAEANAEGCTADREAICAALHIDKRSVLGDVVGAIRKMEIDRQAHCMLVAKVAPERDMLVACLREEIAKIKTKADDALQENKAICAALGIEPTDDPLETISETRRHLWSAAPEGMETHGPLDEVARMVAASSVSDRDKLRAEVERGEKDRAALSAKVKEHEGDYHRALAMRDEERARAEKAEAEVERLRGSVVDLEALVDGNLRRSVQLAHQKLDEAGVNKIDADGDRDLSARVADLVSDRDYLRGRIADLGTARLGNEENSPKAIEEAKAKIAALQWRADAFADEARRRVDAEQKLIVYRHSLAAALDHLALCAACTINPEAIPDGDSFERVVESNPYRALYLEWIERAAQRAADSKRRETEDGIPF